MKWYAITCPFCDEWVYISINGSTILFHRNIHFEIFKVNKNVLLISICLFKLWLYENFVSSATGFLFDSCSNWCRKIAHTYVRLLVLTYGYTQALLTQFYNFAPTSLIINVFIFYISYKKLLSSKENVLIFVYSLFFKWRPSMLCELTPYQISLGLTHLGSEASKWWRLFMVWLNIQIFLYKIC